MAATLNTALSDQWTKVLDGPFAGAMYANDRAVNGMGSMSSLIVRGV